MIISVLVWILLLVLKTICLVLLFYHLFKHNEFVKSSEILRPEIIKKRNVRNAINLSGQLAGALSEMAYTIIIGIMVASGTFLENRDFFAIFKLSEFFIMPLVETLTSPPLRRFVLRK